MRWIGGLLAVLALGACIPGSRDRPPPRPGQSRPATAPRVVRPMPPDPNHRQCLADLGAAGAEFQPLPDRDFGNGCSAVSSVKLLAIGIPITNLGAIRCRPAERLTRWTQEAVQTAATAWLDARVVRMESFGTYACRPVNNRAGARPSQHASANAVDIAAFVLENGRRITVEQGWNGADEHVRNFLRAVHKAACRRFDVVIGPAGDAAHYNHFHFDMAGGRGYCR